MVGTIARPIGLASQQLLAELAGMLATVTGEDDRWAAAISRSSRLEGDLRLESIELAAFAGLLTAGYGDRVDLAAFLAGLDLDQLIALTVGELIDYLLARGVGYPAALDALHRSVSPAGLVPSPAGQVLASTAALPTAQPGPLSRFGLAVALAGPPPPAAAVTSQFARGLLGLHYQLLEHGLKQAMQHLGERISGGSSLLSMQLIRGQLAEIAIDLSEHHEVLAHLPADDPQARWRLHEQLTDAGRRLLRLLGASSFLADGPGRDLHLAEVAGNVYLRPAEDERDEPG
jgi:hypothetical protein